MIGIQILEQFMYYVKLLAKMPWLTLSESILSVLLHPPNFPSGPWQHLQLHWNGSLIHYFLKIDVFALFKDFSFLELGLARLSLGIHLLLHLYHVAMSNCTHYTLLSILAPEVRVRFSRSHVNVSDTLILSCVTFQNMVGSILSLNPYQCKDTWVTHLRQSAGVRGNTSCPERDWATLGGGETRAQTRRRKENCPCFYTQVGAAK